VIDPSFNPEGSGFDMKTAKKASMFPATHGPNKGHMGSIAEDRLTGTLQFLKGRQHPTFDLGVEAERRIGNEVVKTSSGLRVSRKKKKKRKKR
jgi:hypothetical protein